MASVLKDLIFWGASRDTACRHKVKDTIVKFSDDTAIVSLILGDQDDHGQVVTDWLYLNLLTGVMSLIYV